MISSLVLTLYILNCWHVILFLLFQGGNDYEIFMDERTIGHKVTSPEDTINQVKQLF